MKDTVIMVLKIILIMVFAMFMVWGFHDFDIKAVFEFAREKTLVFIYVLFMAGFLGWITVNKYNRND